MHYIAENFRFDIVPHPVYVTVLGSYSVYTFSALKRIEIVIFILALFAFNIIVKDNIIFTLIFIFMWTYI